MILEQFLHDSFQTSSFFFEIHKHVDATNISLIHQCCKIIPSFNHGFNMVLTIRTGSPDSSSINTFDNVAHAHAVEARGHGCWKPLTGGVAHVAPRVFNVINDSHILLINMLFLILDDLTECKIQNTRCSELFKNLE